MAPEAAKTSRIKTTEKAQACANCSSVMHSRMRVVMSVQWTDTRKIVALMAVIEWMKRYFMPASTAGRTSGTVIDVKVFTDDAPRLRLASSIEGSICESAAMTLRIPADE